MDKNFFLAIFLSVLVYIGWFTFIEKRYGPALEPRPIPEAGPRTVPTSAPPRREATLSAPSPDPVQEKGGLDGALTFKVGELDIKIQPYGASIVQFLYPDTLGPVELIEDPYPGFFSTWTDLKFERAGSDRNWPAFVARHPSGVSIHKEYIFQSLDMIHTLRIRLDNPGVEPVVVPSFDLQLGPGLGTVDTEKDKNSTFWKAAALHPPESEGKSPRFEEFDLSEETVAHETPWRWLAVHNRYFLAAIFPPPDRFKRFHDGTRKKTTLLAGWFGGKKPGNVLAPRLRAETAPINLPAGGTVTIEIPFYFGPKGYYHLRSIGHDLEQSVSFGWFRPVGLFTLYILDVFHRLTRNWGWSIIMLTICLQIVMFPLTYKSTKSMVMMKKVAPEQAKLQQKFKNNPQRLNQEMMALYKHHKVNPLGGCLPMLAQMPIFIALFNMLSNAWELHGAPWMLWIQDLSAADPYYILPVIMGGIMYFQGKLNPTPGGDPAQAKMMQMMPVIMTFMFLNFPAGLVLYWLTNSILSFLQQLAIKKRLGA